MAISNKTLLLLVLFGTLALGKAYGQSRGVTSKKVSATITGIFTFDNPVDTVSLYMWKNPIGKLDKFFCPYKKIDVKVEHGRFQFKIDSANSYKYISLGWGKYQDNPYFFLDLFAIEPGDYLRIKVNNKFVEERDKNIITADNGSQACANCNDFVFSGKGAIKYQARWDLFKDFESLKNKWYDTSPLATKPVKSFIEGARREFDEMHFLDSSLNLMLNHYKNEMLPHNFNLIKADCIGLYFSDFLTEMAGDLRDMKISNSERIAFETLYNKAISKITSNRIPATILAASAYYPQFLIEKEYLEKLLYQRGNVFNDLKSKYPNSLRERLLVNYVFKKRTSGLSVDTLLSKVFPLIKSRAYLEILDSFSGTKINTPLDFSLINLSGATVSLSDFKGKIVFLDFWFYGCSGCIHFYQNTLSRLESHFKNNPDIVFVSISIDGNKSYWSKAIESGIYTSMSAVNLNTGKKSIGHPLVKKLKIVSYPALFILGRDGKIADNNSSDIQQSTFEDLKQKLDNYIDKL